MERYAFREISFNILAGKCDELGNTKKFTFDFFSCLEGDSGALINVLADAVPFEDDDVSDLPIILLTTFREICGLNLRQIYGQNSGFIVKRLVRRLICFVGRNSENVQQKVRSYFEQATSLYGYGGGVLESWLNRYMHYIIPCLMLAPSESSSIIHKTISKLCGTNRHNLISENMRHILVKLALRNLNATQYNEIYEFIQKEGVAIGKDGKEKRFEFNQYVVWDLFPCVYELLMQLGASKDRIVGMLAQIRLFVREDTPSTSSIIGDNERKVVEFVRPRLLGVLSKFTGKFIGRCPFDEKYVALESLIVWMEMCAGEVLTEVSSKMMSTLRAAAALNDDRWNDSIAKAWRVFLTSVSNSTMKEVALPVFLAIVPLLPVTVDVQSNEVELLLQLLFVEKRFELTEQIADIGFFAKAIESPLLHVYCPLFDDDSRPLTDLLSTVLKLLQNEHPDAKRLSLERLKILLRHRSAELYKMILEPDNVDDIVYQLVNTLTSTLRHSDVNVRRLAAVCMGNLGAIDPGRLRADSLSVVAASVRQHDVIFLDFENKRAYDFPCVLLREVTKLLLGASDSFYDICSWSLQEILRFFGCRDDGIKRQTSAAYIIWSNLDEATKKIVTPFLSTR